MNRTYILGESLEKVLKAHDGDNTLLDSINTIATASLDIWKKLALDYEQASNDTQHLNNFGELTKHIDLYATGVIAAKVKTLNQRIWLVTEEDASTRSASNCTHALFVDPIDGSKHVRYQGECGTIFSMVSMEGANYGKSISSGYFLYGYQLTFVIAVGDTLLKAVYSPRIKQFIVTENGFKIAPEGRVYSINDADIDEFTPLDRKFIKNLRELHFTCRYNGVLVADLHRIIIEGGIFISPQLSSGKVKAKKYFEAIAIEHIMHAAGGGSIYKYIVGRDLETESQQKELFSSVPLVFGSKQEVEGYRKIQP